MILFVADVEVDRVLFFSSAIQGYASLLLDLQQGTANKTLDDLLVGCEAVMIAANKDRKLPRKLVDSNRHLEWIKTIKDRHGSVEESSMISCQRINETGEYKISKAGQITLKYKQLVRSEEDMEVEVEDENLETRTFKYADLKELRSKLMLITTGADGKLQVERFTKILALVETVADTLSELASSCCLLFEAMITTLFCEVKKKVKMTVQFGYSNRLLQSEATLEDELASLATFLKVKITYKLYCSC